MSIAPLPYSPWLITAFGCLAFSAAGYTVAYLNSEDPEEDVGAETCAGLVGKRLRNCLVRIAAVRVRQDLDSSRFADPVPSFVAGTAFAVAALLAVAVALNRPRPE